MREREREFSLPLPLSVSLVLSIFIVYADVNACTRTLTHTHTHTGVKGMVAQRTFAPPNVYTDLKICKRGPTPVVKRPTHASSKEAS